MLHPSPSLEEVRRLAEWCPPLGVVSVYLKLDPADRAGAWHTELRNDLSRILWAANGLDHEVRTALRATAERVTDRFASRERRLPRGEVGFVAVAEEPASERWWSTHLPPRSADSAYFAERPVVAPLLCTVARATPRGVALLSAERARLLEWEPGRVEELHSWELTLFSGDWRERKAPRAADPARAQGVSATGREQHAERLAENRQRFLGQCGGLAARIASERGWPQIVAFGAPEQIRGFREGPRRSPSHRRRPHRERDPAAARARRARAWGRSDRHRVPGETGTRLRGEDRDGLRRGRRAARPGRRRGGAAALLSPRSFSGSVGPDDVQIAEGG
jgi:Bacterial archaeo-eukaryotic release factor family 5